MIHFMDDLRVWKGEKYIDERYDCVITYIVEGVFGYEVLV